MRGATMSCIGWLASAQILAWLLSSSSGNPAGTCSKVVRLLKYVTFLFFYKKFSGFFLFLRSVASLSHYMLLFSNFVEIHWKKQFSKSMFFVLVRFVNYFEN